jgi:hypothetical protein
MLGCVARKNSKFFNCGAHKSVEKKFVQSERESIKLSEMYSKVFQVLEDERSV